MQGTDQPPVARSFGREFRTVDITGVIVQANELLPRLVVLVAATSHTARAASFRPEIELLNETSRVLVEQVGAIDAGRLGELVGRVTPEEQWGIDEALTTVLGLR